MIIKSEGNAYGFGFRHRGYAVRLLQEVENPQGIDTPSLQGRLGEASKVIRNGQLYIIRDGKEYDVLGTQTK